VSAENPTQPRPQHNRRPPHRASPPPLRASAPPSGARSLSPTAFAQDPGTRDGVSCLANVWSGPPSYSVYTVAGNGNGNDVTDGSSTTLDSRGQTLYLLFCVSAYEHARMAGGYGVWGKGYILGRFWTYLD
jgi:hypothetical protein